MIPPYLTQPLVDEGSGVGGTVIVDGNFEDVHARLRILKPDIIGISAMSLRYGKAIAVAREDRMAVLEPRLSILDEIDSGLDIDALRVVARGVNALRRADRAVLLVTHYKRLLEYIPADRIHVMAGGRIVRSGGPELAEELERTGYAWADGMKPEVRGAAGAPASPSLASAPEDRR